MKKCIINFLFLLVIFAQGNAYDCRAISSYEDVAKLFPSSMEEMESICVQAQINAEVGLQEVFSVQPDYRNFTNTVKAIDDLIAELQAAIAPISIINKVHPDKGMRQKALDLLIEMDRFITDRFEYNKSLNIALKEYCFYNLNQLNISQESAYYLAKVFAAFEELGIDSGEEKMEKQKELMNQIAFLNFEFEKNIAEDNSCLKAKRERLIGLSNEFINSLEREGDYYILKCDYPTIDAVMSWCQDGNTRKEFYKIYTNRAYPKNLQVLKEMILKRQELAKFVGYQSFAELQLSTQMAKTPENVENFLNSLTSEAIKSAQEEWNEILSDLPEGVELNENGMLNPWDDAYVSSHYLKEHFNFDKEQFSEYFPLDETLRNYLAIFEKFFGLELRLSGSTLFWDDSVQLIEIIDPNSNQTLGYTILDLFPREGKFTHACCSSILPTIVEDDNVKQPAVALIIANFTRPTENCPALLRPMELVTFLHEFGHSMHAILGRSELLTQAAFNTTLDFVEMPSQLLEEWFTEPQILRKVGRHYLTNEQLPEELIETVINTKNFQKGKQLARQLVLSKLSLHYYIEDQVDDLFTVVKEYSDAGIPVIAHDTDNHFPCSFGHLGEYGARYYCYLWSKDLASKFFDYIQKHGGVEDPVVGAKYSEVLKKGGSCDPENLVTQFLSE